MKLSFVKQATVECITSEELKEGDFILWSNHKAKVVSMTSIFKHRGEKGFAKIQLFPEDKENILEIPRYHTFFRIIDCELIKKEV